MLCPVPPHTQATRPWTAPSEPGEEFLLARLRRAQAIPAAQRTPEVAAFVEVMQLDEEACALLPLVQAPGADDGGAAPPQPALPASEATAQRVLLAILRFFRMQYLTFDLQLPSQKLGIHLCSYLEQGCEAPFLPMERCVAELPAQLRRNGGAQSVGTYLWLFAANLLHWTPSDLEMAIALQRIGDALAAACPESLDQQLCQLQGVASTSALPLSSKQLQWTCFRAAYIAALDLESQVVQARQIIEHSAARMSQLEPLNPCSLTFASQVVIASADTSTNPLGIIANMIRSGLQVFEAAKQQHLYSRALTASSNVVLRSEQFLAAGAGAMLGRSTILAAVEAFQEAEASYQPIKRLLPELWVHKGEAFATTARQAVPRLQQYLAGSGPGQQRTPAQRLADAEYEALRMSLPQRLEACCYGCNTVAQGLRKCSRCRRVGYCW